MITEAPQSVSFSAMAERQQAAAQVILQDPDVHGLSSFIGLDGSWWELPATVLDDLTESPDEEIAEAAEEAIMMAEAMPDEDDEEDDKKDWIN